MERTTALLQLEGIPGATGPVPFILRGPAEAHVFFEGANEGDAFDDDGNGLGEVETELVSLNLTDGNVTLTLNPAMQSLGRIEEQANNTFGILDIEPFATGLADSFFDVFFQLDVPGVGVLHNQDGLRLESVIDHKPPTARYRHLLPPEGGLELFDAAGNPTGVRIVKAEHYTGEIEIDEFPNTTGQILIELPSEPGVITARPDLPVVDGVYRTAEEVHAQFSGDDLEIVLQDIRHRPFAYPPPERDPSGDDEFEFFQSSLFGTAVVTSASLGLDQVPLLVELTGPVQTVVHGKAGNTTGTFATEILSMDLSGDMPLPGGGTLQVIIQESPSQDSQGQTTITDLGGGQFQIDSFFDVFTEISVDGGQNFIPSTGNTRVDLAAPPILVPLTGPSTAHVFFEGAEGQADDDDGNNLDEVETELVALHLSGMTPQGPIVAKLRDDLSSSGQIEEQVDVETGLLDVAPFTEGAVADSFFDVWTEISIGGQVLITAQPLHLESPIRHKPPQDGERYVNPFLTRVELIDPQTGEGTGMFILREVHQPDPTIEIDFMERTTALLQLEGVPGATGPVPFILRGPAEAHVFFEGANEGDAFDDDGNGLGEVETELVSLNLTDGNVTLTLNPAMQSLGRIEEQANNTFGILDIEPFATGLADSFFDVFFQLDVPGVGVLHNQDGLRLESVIDHKPPTARYRHLLPRKAGSSCSTRRVTRRVCESSRLSITPARSRSTSSRIRLVRY